MTISAKILKSQCNLISAESLKILMLKIIESQTKHLKTVIEQINQNTLLPVCPNTILVFGILSFINKIISYHIKWHNQDLKMAKKKTNQIFDWVCRGNTALGLCGLSWKAEEENQISSISEWPTFLKRGIKKVSISDICKLFDKRLEKQCDNPVTDIKLNTKRKDAGRFC